MKELVLKYSLIELFIQLKFVKLMCNKFGENVLSLVKSPAYLVNFRFGMLIYVFPVESLNFLKFN